MKARAGQFVLLVIGTAGTLTAQPQPAAPAGAEAPWSQAVSRDEALWHQIRELDRGLSAIDPFSDGVEAALQRRRTLLETTRLYLAAYPGGRRSAEAVHLELETLFEIGTLSEGAYEPLRTRVEEYLHHPPSEAGLHEAAYWEIHCRRLARAPAASAPSASIALHDPELLEAYRAYIEGYPRSRHVPRMAAQLFEAAPDRDEQRRLVTRLRRDFPEHAVTASLTARLQRGEAVGQRFALAFSTTDGTEIDTAPWKGRPVLIVVWAGFSEKARACVSEIEAFRQEHGQELRVVGVNLDGSEQQMGAACDELGVRWPQLNDGMGWANRFARKWGVRTVPWVFVVDRNGRLTGSGKDETWRELVAGLLEN